MDISQQTAVVPKGRESAVVVKRQRRSIAEKRRIVEETLVEGASVARVARAHGVNANQVFYWRKLYQAGRLGITSAARLLPVRVTGESSPPPAIPLPELSSSGTIHIELRQAQVRIEGSADPALVRLLLECLRAWLPTWIWIAAA
jgi:transposase